MLLTIGIGSVVLSAVFVGKIIVFPIIILYISISLPSFCFICGKRFAFVKNVNPTLFAPIYLFENSFIFFLSEFLLAKCRSSSMLTSVRRITISTILSLDRLTEIFQKNFAFFHSSPYWFWQIEINNVGRLINQKLKCFILGYLS